jgi:hypothetical protein
MGEVDRGLAAGDVLLLEVRLLRWAVHGSPVTKATLQRTHLARAVTSRSLLLENLDDCRCL